jgi:outer membrane protein assembly factor BamB
MKRSRPSVPIALGLCALLGVVARPDLGHAEAQPTITSLSASALARSGRLVIRGSGFGATRGSDAVEIGGVSAPVTRWSDASITAYVAETTPLGQVGVQVVTGGGASNVVPLDVTTRSASGRVQWRFQADSSYIVQSPAVGLDGTVVAHDSDGFVYSLQPDGGLKWIFRTGGADGPPAIDSAGTVYAASLDSVYAIDGTDGTLKWQFTDGGGQGVIAGPNVGPDGNIYVVMDFGGQGAVALSPSGSVLWTNPGDPPFNEYGQIGSDVVFGPGSAAGSADQLYVAFDGVSVSPSTVWALSLDGAQRWAVGAGGSDDLFMQQQRQLAVGPDGTVYLTGFSSTSGWRLMAFDPASGANKWTYAPSPANGMSRPSAGPNGVVYLSRSLSHLDAVSPSGVQLWQFFDGSIVDHPTISPAGSILFTGARPNFGVPGLARAHDPANGQLLWSIPLGSENGGSQILYSRPRFRGDARAVYFGTTILGSDPNNEYCYLYAVDASVTPANTVTITGAVYNPATQALSVQATASTPTAQLTAYLNATSRRVLGNLNNLGGGSYSGTFSWPSNPGTIHVRNNLGGTASAPVVQAR